MSSSTPPQWPVKPPHLSASGKMMTPVLRSAPTPPIAPSTGRQSGFLRKLAIVVVALAMVGVLSSGIGYLSLAHEVSAYPGVHFNLGKNAVWLEHAWAGQPHRPADYDALANDLKAHQIRYVYVHVGPLSSDGTIAPDLAPFAGAFATAMHQRVPGIHVLAWIGQLEAASGKGATETVVDLASPSVREQIALSARHFTLDLQFDGVHYDIEPITNNNAHFLDLLDVTRQKLPAGSILSISAEKWAPSARVAQWLFDKGQASSWWTTYYYQQIASHVDQIVLLPYNSAMPTDDAYQLFVKQQVEHVLDAAATAPTPPDVLVGVPTYPGDNKYFHDKAENMQSGLDGVVAGLNARTSSGPFVGVAIYRYGTTSASSWRAYDSYWLGI